MPIDTDALNRHAQAQIEHLPVTAIYQGVEFQASWTQARAALQAVEGGIVSLGGGSLICMKADLPGGKPPQMGSSERVEIKHSETHRVSYAVAAIFGDENPNTGELTLILVPEGEG